MNQEELNRKLLKLLEQNQAKFKLEEGQLTVESDRSTETINLPPQVQNEEVSILHEKQFDKKRRQPAERKASIVFEFKLTGKV